MNVLTHPPHGVLQGLSATPPRINPMWLYDAVGSALFETITRLDAYYPTRTEVALLQAFSRDMCAASPSGSAVVEFGSGSAAKVGHLLAAMNRPRAYHPIDVSRAAIDATRHGIERMAPNLRVEGLLGDFMDTERLHALLERTVSVGPVTLFFPGSTLGNLRPEAAVDFLQAIRSGVPRATPFLLGVDRIKPINVLIRAYDDPAGVTAAFNKNVLNHLNRACGADFDLSAWRHEARWNDEEKAVEMWLIPTSTQKVTISGHELRFDPSVGIHTESSRKYTLESIQELGRASGWRVDREWSDPRNWFSVIRLMAA